MREMDLLMLGYLERRWPEAPLFERDAFVQLIEELDQDILDWLLGRAPIPEAYRCLIPWLKLATNS